MTLKFIRRNKVEAVVAFGGFTSLGPALAARWQGVPIFVHEANRAAGKAVRFYPDIAGECISLKVCSWKEFQMKK